MRQIVPVAVPDVDPAVVYADLPEAAGRPAVRVNMIASVDGAVTIDGRSGALGGPPDRLVYRLLRTFADIILVAAGTVRIEGYGPARMDDAQRAARRARGQAELPRIAVVSRGLDLDWTAPLFTEAAPPTILVTTHDAPTEALEAARDRATVITAGHGDVDLHEVMRALGDLGARHVLCEGGPSLNGALAGADLIDELCLTISPVLGSGDAKRIVTGPPLATPTRFELRSVLEEDGFLLTRYRATGPGAGDRM